MCLSTLPTSCYMYVTYNEAATAAQTKWGAAGCTILTNLNCTVLHTGLWKSLLHIRLMRGGSEGFYYMYVCKPAQPTGCHVSKSISARDIVRPPWTHTGYTTNSHSHPPVSHRHDPRRRPAGLRTSPTQPVRTETQYTNGLENTTLL